jgi:hypothetical protein
VKIQGFAVTLTPNKETTGFVRKGKALVFSTIGNETLTPETVAETARGEHEERHRRNSGVGLGRSRKP